MPFQLSPGVNVTEIDLTTIVPAVATTDAALAGVFRWGPVEKTLLVSNEDELVRQYGKPTNLNAETFFTAASFLSYSNRLYISRASHTTGDFTTQTTITESGNTTVVIESTGLTTLAAEQGVFGDNIPEGTTIVSVSESGSNTEVVLSDAPTTTNTGLSVQYFDNNYCFNAIANTNAANLNSQIVKNEDFIDGVNFDDDVQFVAKYPGVMGNSLRISVCDNADAFQSNIDLTAVDANNTTSETIAFVVGSNTATVSVSNTATGNATTSEAVVDSVVADLQIGDVIEVGNTILGTEYLTISSISEVSVDGGTASFTISFDDRFSLAEDYSTSTIRRYWEFWDLVDGAPGQSLWQLRNGNTAAQDELHVVVVDEDGLFSGVPGTTLEVFKAMSRATDAKDEEGATLYYKELLNQNSNYVWWAGDISGATSAQSAILTSSTNTQPYNKSFVGGRDTLDENSVSIGDLARAYDLYRNAETIDISLVLTGKARGASNGAQLANYLIDNIAERRKDCVVFLSPDKADVVENNGGDTEFDVVDFRNSCRSTSYAVMDSGYKYMYDKYNDLYRWIPLNGDIAGLSAYTDDIRDPWWSPAGLNRGQIKNVVRLAWNPNKAQRDILYKNGVNPVVNFPGQGNVLFGDKTLLSKPSAFDRINVRRLFIVLEKAIATVAKFTLFEFNDQFTRASFVNLVTPYLRDIQGRRGIQDFVVICDTTNNTGEVIDRNEFVGDIYIKPTRSINFIQLNFVAVRTGVEFSEVIGNF